VTETLDVRVAPNGRMVLPNRIRKSLGLSGGGVLLVSIEGDHVELRSAAHGVAEAQALYRAHVVDDQSSDDFLESRRAEAALENGD
jgi:AbrB family looped-hinge helix DNA binding protein